MGSGAGGQLYQYDDRGVQIPIDPDWGAIGNLVDEQARKDMNDFLDEQGLAAWKDFYNNDVVFNSIKSGFYANTKISDQARMTNLQMALDKYKKSSSSGNTGPTTQQYADQFYAEIQNLAGMMGIQEGGDWRELANKAAANHWNVEMLRDAVGEFINMDHAKNPGLVHDAMDHARSVGSDYMVKVSDDQALSWAKRIAMGDMDVSSIDAAVKDQAKAQYSWLADRIDAGVKLKDYFQPHREEIAKLLETNVDSIDLVNDKRWADVLHKVPTSEDPTDRSMTVVEVGRYVRSMDAWKSTNNAKSSGAEMVAALGSIMGSL
jgi:hypothetical protein